jgi:hypothetical protein
VTAYLLCWRLNAACPLWPECKTQWFCTGRHWYFCLSDRSEVILPFHVHPCRREDSNVFRWPEGEQIRHDAVDWDIRKGLYLKAYGTCHGFSSCRKRKWIPSQWRFTISTFAVAVGVNRYRKQQATGIALFNVLPQSWRDRCMNPDCAPYTSSRIHCMHNQTTCKSGIDLKLEWRYDEYLIIYKKIKSIPVTSRGGL